jgi:type III secretion protein K
MTLDLDTAPATPTRSPLEMIRLVAGFNLHPELGLHPSWLPPDWPARHHQPLRWGSDGRSVLCELLRRRDVLVQEPLFNFDARLKRLALLDARSLRRLAAYTGLSAHSALLKQRSELGNELRRQAQRFDRDAVEFLLDRVPPLNALKMDLRPMQARPQAVGRLVVARGYRLLMGAVASEGETPLRRVQLKFPRRVSAFGVPQLRARQVRQLDELMLLCIVPERLPEWDWLF